MVSACRTGLESLVWVKHSGGSDLLTGGVNFWFHSNLGYRQPLGSHQLTQDPLQRTLKRYLVGSCTMGEVKKRTWHNGRFQLNVPVGSAEIEPSLVFSGIGGARDGVTPRVTVLLIFP
jgi:hypothetical protein